MVLVEVAVLGEEEVVVEEEEVFLEGGRLAEEVTEGEGVEEEIQGVGGVEVLLLEEGVGLRKEGKA